MSRSRGSIWRSRPVENRGGWVEAVRLMRLIRAKSGVIAGNILRGGPDRVLRTGPGGSSTTTFGARLPGTFSHGVFEGHGTHDLLIRGNRTRSVAPSGKTWRFLVLTGFGVQRRHRAEHHRADRSARRRHDSLEQRARDHFDRGLSCEV